MLTLTPLTALALVFTLPLASYLTTGGEVATAMTAFLLGGAACYLTSRYRATGHLARSQREAEGVLDNARKEGQTLVKQIELDARNDRAQRREAFEAEVQQERAELKEQDRRLSKREDVLDRKLDVLATKEKRLADHDEQIKGREDKVAVKERELEGLVEQRRKENEEHARARKAELLRVSGLNEEQGRKEALAVLEQECGHEAAQIVQRHTERAEEEARQAALNITLQAIQRYASEHTAESTANAVPIPSDDMKGRVIGREGRNIRAFEKATGVDVIVDDTPGVVVVSCFDPVRRATAAETLRKLLEDGRIHPARIEEVAEQVQKEMADRVIKFGKEACVEAHIQGLHPKISETMGRLHYRTSYGQNILRHSMETAYLCQTIANELGLDGDLARRCGFLHDIGKAMDHEVEGGHPAIGADFLRRHGERTEAVLNAVAGHHNDIPSTTPYTPIVMAADAISGARPGARARDAGEVHQAVGAARGHRAGHARRPRGVRHPGGSRSPRRGRPR